MIKTTNKPVFDFNQFETDGFTVIENFSSLEEVNALTQACWDIVDRTDITNVPKFPFKRGGNRTITNNYFFDSGNKMRLFYEPTAIDDDGVLTVDKRNAFNKLAHALHALDPSFRKFTFGKKIQRVVRDVGFIDPIVFQSMCMFKPPEVGSEIAPHQDLTYVHVDSGKLVTFWLALEDADVENACLWFIPGSHKDGLHNNKRMIKDIDADGEVSAKIVGKTRQYKPEDFVAVPVKKGSMVVFDGFVVHKSEPNTSSRSRLAYSFNVYDAAAGAWDSDNCLQPTSEGNFVHLYSEEKLLP